MIKVKLAYLLVLSHVEIRIRSRRDIFSLKQEIRANVDAIGCAESQVFVRQTVIGRFGHLYSLAIGVWRDG